MTAIHGAAAAVTGAASGIGRALAIELAARGCDLALADRDEAGLQALAAEVGRTGSQKVSIHRVDVSEASQIAAARGQLDRQRPADAAGGAGHGCGGSTDRGHGCQLQVGTGTRFLRVRRARRKKDKRSMTDRAAPKIKRRARGPPF